MILSNNYIRQRLGFAAFQNFAALPALEALVSSGSLTDLIRASLSAKDPRWSEAYANAQAIAAGVDAIAGEPEAAVAVQQANAATQSLQGAIASAAANANFATSLITVDQAKLLAYNFAIEAILKSVKTTFPNEVAPALANARAAIEARKMREAALKQRELEAQIAAQQADATKSVRIATDEEVLRATAATEAAKQQVIETKNVVLATEAQIAAKAALAKASEPKILGLPMSTAIPIGLGGVALLYVLTKRPSARPMQGYRRRSR